MTSTLPLVALGALGGTISMTTDSNTDSGISSTLGAEEIRALAPGLEQYARIMPKTLNKVASGSITFDDLFRTLDWAIQSVQAGAQAVVITQGTDTLEETAYFFDLYWPHSEPIILMGAMRHPEMAGADGPANLYAAILVACAPESRNRGALVVMNDEIHEARHVRKMHTTFVNSFCSPLFGAVGWVLEGKVYYQRPTTRQNIFPIPSQYNAKVALIEATLDMDPDLINLLIHANYAGIVVAGFGSGHTSEPIRDALVVAAKHIPVIICSRTGSGSTTYQTYGYKGSEVDFQAHGIRMGGWLDARKTRLRLLAELWSKEKI